MLKSSSVAALVESHCFRCFAASLCECTLFNLALGKSRAKKHISYPSTVTCDNYVAFPKIKHLNTKPGVVEKKAIPTELLHKQK